MKTNKRNKRLIRNTKKVLKMRVNMNKTEEEKKKKTDERENGTKVVESIW